VARRRPGRAWAAALAAALTLPAAALAALLALPAAAQQPPPPAAAPGPHDRAEAVAIVRELRRIVAPTGLQATEWVPIGGQRQAVAIRSQDLRNPVLIYLHGGPGFVEMPLGWWYDRGWDEYFTVVQWDQRNAGKSYVANGPADPATLTPDRFQADAEELVQWARRRFCKRRVFVLGHSWGSVLGLRLAAAHPDWLHAYVGMAQLTDGPESERRGWAWTLARARADGNAAAVRELEALRPYAAGTAPETLERIMVQRKWLNHYGGAAWRRTGGEFEAAAMALSPEYSDEDVRLAFRGQPAVSRAMLPPILATDLTGIRTLRVPMVLLLGRHDVNLSSDVSAAWFARLRAPAKRLVWFERSGHHLTSEEPGKLFRTLVDDVRPIAVRAGDAAP
jgi:proline iminopeptidase